MHLATAKDRGEFEILWSEFLEERHRAGSPILASTGNLRTYMQLFDQYVAPRCSLAGVAVIEPGNGCLLWGETDTALALDLGIWAMGWGTYVRPMARHKGLSERMRDLAKRTLKEMGFARVIGEYDHENKAGEASGLRYGFKLVASRGVLEL